MTRILIFFISLTAVLSSCEQRELHVLDYSFDTSYTPVDTICWKDDQIIMRMNVDNYLADEDLTLQYRINNSVEDTLTINGQTTLEPITFDPHIDRFLTIQYTPSQRGSNVICLTISNSHYSRQDYITVRAKEEVTYDYKYNGYEIHITTIEGV